VSALYAPGRQVVPVRHRGSGCRPQPGTGFPGRWHHRV